MCLSPDAAIQEEQKLAMPGFWVKVALGKPHKALLLVPTRTPYWRQRQASILITSLIRKCSSTSAQPNSSLAHPHTK